MQQTKISIQPLRRLARGKGCEFLKRRRTLSFRLPRDSTCAALSCGKDDHVRNLNVLGPCQRVHDVVRAVRTCKRRHTWM